MRNKLRNEKKHLGISSTYPCYTIQDATPNGNFKCYIRKNCTGLRRTSTYGRYQQLSSSYINSCRHARWETTYGKQYQYRSRLRCTTITVVVLPVGGIILYDTYLSTLVEHNVNAGSPPNGQKSDRQICTTAVLVATVLGVVLRHAQALKLNCWNFLSVRTTREGLSIPALCHHRNRRKKNGKERRADTVMADAFK